LTIPYAVVAWIVTYVIEENRNGKLKMLGYKEMEGLMFSSIEGGRYPYLDPRKAEQILRENNLLMEDFEFMYYGKHYVIPFRREGTHTHDGFNALKSHTVPVTGEFKFVWQEYHLFKPKKMVFCPSCNSQVPWTKFCSNCGIEF
jgi:hypothetical protein